MIPGQELIDTFNVSRGNMEALMRKMREANIISSNHGPGGGYYFVKDIADISLADVISITTENNLKNDSTYTFEAEKVVKKALSGILIFDIANSPRMKERYRGCLRLQS